MHSLCNVIWQKQPFHLWFNAAVHCFYAYMHSRPHNVIYIQLVSVHRKCVCMLALGNCKKWILDWTHDWTIWNEIWTEI